MSSVDGNLKLNEINIPGTHDSATQYVKLALFSKCQCLNIKEQLDAGFRYLDIRLAVDNEKLKLVHGFTPAKQTIILGMKISTLTPFYRSAMIF